MVNRLLIAATSVRSFALCERASVAVASALVLPVLLGMTGLAIEYGDALATRAEIQRAADLAVYAGVLAYGSGDAAAMTAAVRSVAQLNGVAADEIRADVDANSVAGPVVRVTITRPRPLVLATFVSAKTSLDVTVRSAAVLEKGAPACVQALDPSGSGITMSGGTSITATGCAVASNAAVTASGSSKIVTTDLTYDSASAPDVTGGASISSPSGGSPRITRTSVPDPMADSEAIALARSQMSLVQAMQAPAKPAVPSGPNIDFGWNTQTTQQQAIAVGCTASISGSTWTFTCPAGASVNIGNLTIGGGLNLDFATTGTADTTYSFSGSVTNTGTVMRFGPGTYNIAGGLFTGGGTTTTFAAGTFRIGRATTSCSSSGNFSICNLAALSFAGPSVFELEGGILNTGTATLGTGGANSFRSGPASSGFAIRLESGSTLTLGEATASSNVFQVKGNIATGGNSCLVVGAAPNHDIAGYLDVSGGAIFGSGVYTIDGYMHLGASAGGSAWCQEKSVSMLALGVTFIISGKGAPGRNQNCNGEAAFCASSGYSSMQIVPPTSGPFARLAVIGPLSSDVTAGASFEGGAHGGQIAGTFYFPNGPVSLSGGASASGSAAGCLQIIGASVSLSGGTSIASECVMSGTAGGASVRMIE